MSLSTTHPKNWNTGIVFLWLPSPYCIDYFLTLKFSKKRHQRSTQILCLHLQSFINPFCIPDTNATKSGFLLGLLICASAAVSFIWMTNWINPTWPIQSHLLPNCTDCLLPISTWSSGQVSDNADLLSYFILYPTPDPKCLFETNPDLIFIPTKALWNEIIKEIFGKITTLWIQIIRPRV